VVLLCGVVVCVFVFVFVFCGGCVEFGVCVFGCLVCVLVLCELGWLCVWCVVWWGVWYVVLVFVWR
jgi:hypothetical protein